LQQYSTFKEGAPIRASILIPVHNEEHRIRDLLQSLLQQDYPVMEVVFIDDRSTDKTPALLLEFKEQFEALGHRCIIYRLQENPGPNYKQYGLGVAYGLASGEILLLTDGDCELPKTWVSGMVQRLSDPSIGLLAGPVFKKIPEPSFLYKCQSYDHIVRDVYMIASMGIGAASGGFGNNLAVKRAALEAAGGYTAVPRSVTEDAALISWIHKKTPYRIHAAVGSDVAVMTEAESSWFAFIVQTIRWTKGGLFSPDIRTKVSFTFLMIVITLGILSLLLLPIVSSLWPLFGAVLVSMVINHSMVVILAKQECQKFTIIDILIQLLCMPALNAFLTILCLLRIPVYWKGKRV
ncbi:MAG: glycosyltransferase, partial [Termitinemataceae bacterium]